MAGKVYRGEIFSEFIAFAVPAPLLERAFTHTYGLELKDLFPEHNLARTIRVYQRVLSDLYPRLTQVAWKLKRREILVQHPHIAEKDFLYSHSLPKEARAAVGRHYEEPKFVDKAITLRPCAGQVGLLESLDFDVPTPETEKLFVKSMGIMREWYLQLLGDIDTGRLEVTQPESRYGSADQCGRIRLGRPHLRQTAGHAGERSLHRDDAGLEGALPRVLCGL